MTQRKRTSRTGVSDDGNGKKAKEEVKEEPLAPTEWECSICTLCNPMALTVCEACTSPKPSMEVIMAKFMEALNIGNESKKEPVLGEEDLKGKEKSLYQQRLDSLAKDLSTIVSKEEKRVIKEQKKKEQEEKKR